MLSEKRFGAVHERYLTFAQKIQAMNKVKNKPLWPLMAMVVVLLALFVIGKQLFTPDPVREEAREALENNLLSQPSKPQLQTCQICGYRSIGPDSLLCPVCFVELTEDEQQLWEYETMEEMVEEEQAMFFAAEGFRDSALFHAPLVWQGETGRYNKDTTWNPVIGREKVLKLRDTLMDVGVIEMLQ